MSTLRSLSVLGDTDLAARQIPLDVDEATLEVDVCPLESYQLAFPEPGSFCGRLGRIE
jgi:hypothetical protein